jgi:hypothetical protein
MSALMEDMSPDQLKELKELVGEVLDCLYHGKKPHTRLMIMRALIASLLSALHEWQDTEDKIAEEVFRPKTTDELQLKKIIKAQSLAGLKSKVSQITCLLIGSIGDTKTRKDQIAILNNCLGYFKNIAKNIIEES